MQKRCRYIFSMLGGELSSGFFTPEMGINQITSISSEELSHLFPGPLRLFDQSCLTFMVKEGCFRQEAKEQILELLNSY